MGLIINEWVKIFKRKATYIMFAIIALAVLASSIIIYTSNTDQPENSNWKTNLQNQNEALKADVEAVPGDQNKAYIEREIAQNEYRIEHDMPPTQEYSVWAYMTDMLPMVDLVALFAIIIAAGMVASEFSWGTIKLLLIRPISRVKILLSKYVVVLLFSLLMLSVLFVLSFISGAIFFGMGDPTPYLAYVDGEIIEKSHVGHLIVSYLLESVGLLMFSTMAFMISAAFRNSSLAIGISIFLLLMGGTVTSLLAIKFDWAKYLLFANVDLNQYFDTSPMVEGMTLAFSLITLLVYFIIFHVISFMAFVKRDITA
ncbi:ABC transporter permease [Bacillus sp. V59.32b]|uniref:ABC transporter permease n=1 Tax=Bacillus sp. V59.32b TaxID=1758642 RepID=UPI000E3BA0FE|nr:ABC transporter permease subunit [Bacillus sp. V59.32b]RFU61503.1 ABC transporter permease [Bacillus sp. V59.32b]